jgi:hypothetical protein
MTENLVRHNRPVSRHLHRLVAIAAVGCVLWFVLAAWAFFGGFGYAELSLAVVSGFFLMAVLLPFVLWLTWRRQNPEASRSGGESFRDWVSGDLETGQGRRKASDAMVEVLLPLAAAAIGVTAIGLIFHFSATSAAQAWTI